VIYIVDNHQQYGITGSTPQIQRAINAITAEPCVMEHYTDACLARLEELGAKAVILGGSGDPWESCDLATFAGEFDIIRKASIPVLGICGGHQLIGFAYHVEVGGIGFTEEDYREIDIVEDDPLFNGLKGRFVVRESHHDEVKSLPAKFVLLASNSDCRIQAMRHPKRFVYGVQFHPEFFNQEYPDGRIILENFLKLRRERGHPREPI
jgi:GMP synthase (glutamine-hydrolysing)